ncbi:MAG: hypothetical protein WCT05_08300 [Lentisphaeria bacterium]
MKKASVVHVPRKRGSAVIKWGCLTVVILLLLCLLSVWLFFRAQRRKWTDERPIPVELPLEGGSRQSDGARIYRDTRRAFESGFAQSLHFDNRELNALLNQAPEFKSLIPQMALQLQEDSLLTRMSLPLKGIPGFEGRYLNGDFVFTVQINQGVPQLMLRSGNVHGKPVPEHFLNQINQYGQKELLRRLETQTDLSRIESLRIENGKLILKLREKSR